MVKCSVKKSGEGAYDVTCDASNSAAAALGAKVGPQVNAVVATGANKKKENAAGAAVTGVSQVNAAAAPVAAPVANAAANEATQKKAANSAARAEAEKKLAEATEQLSKTNSGNMVAMGAATAKVAAAQQALNALPKSGGRRTKRAHSARKRVHRSKRNHKRSSYRKQRTHRKRSSYRK